MEQEEKRELGRSRSRNGGEKRRAGKRSPVPVLTAFLFLFILGFLGAAMLYVKKYMPTSKRADLSEYFDVAGDNVQVYLNDEKEKTEKDYLVVGRYKDGHVYLPYDFVYASLNKRFYWASDVSEFLYCLPKEIVKINADETLSDGSPAFFQDGKQLYLNTDWIMQYTDLRCRQFVDTEQKRIFLDNSRGQYTEATLSGREAVRLKGGVKSEVLTILSKGDTVTVLESMEKWSKVRTGDGFIGFLRNSKLTDIRKETAKSDFQAPDYTHITREDGSKIELGFHQITSPQANAGLDALTQSNSGMNVIAPTWFSLSDSEGNFVSYADADYVAMAHAKGYQIFATVNNFDQGDVDEKKLFRDTSIREKLIEALVQAAKDSGIDGLNIDFELVPESVGKDYVQFMRELSVRCRNEGIILSVDCYVPYDYNRYYDIEELGAYCDYVIIMCYDEHYAGSKEAGSVSSISYVDRGIQEAIAEIPKEQVIIAVPFYTRVWITKSDGKLSSEAMGIRRAQEWVKQKGVNLSWDEELGQNYGSVEDSDGRKEIWMEDQKSMQLKMKHIREAGVVGVAAWKLGQEPDGFWENLRMNG